MAISSKNAQKMMKEIEKIRKEKGITFNWGTENSFLIISTRLKQ
jgi:hypothetical protein